MLPFDGRRTSVHIIGEILRLLRLGEAGKTEVMYSVRLTHAQTQRYLARLVELGLVRVPSDERGMQAYRITRKELDILAKIEEVQEMLKVDDLSEILGSPEIKAEGHERHDALTRIRDAILGRYPESDE